MNIPSSLKDQVERCAAAIMEEIARTVVNESRNPGEVTISLCRAPELIKELAYQLIREKHGIVLADFDERPGSRYTSARGDFSSQYRSAVDRNAVQNLVKEIVEATKKAVVAHGTRKALVLAIRITENANFYAAKEILRERYGLSITTESDGRGGQDVIVKSGDFLKLF